ncbi:MAG TPA: hypothetical protein VFK20_00955 [Vicinamibacterales bacterium]|nr:hypothetical protein [Vicinamibacterales bacterium]
MHRGLIGLLLLAIAAGPARAAAPDQIGVARRLYNEQQYDRALQVVREMERAHGETAPLRLLVGRIELEMYRQSARPEDLEAARVALRAIDGHLLDARERLELTIGLAELLYFDDRFGATAELLEPVLDATALLGSSAHERALDWWATALDRQAQTNSGAADAAYARILTKMEAELQKDPSSTPAGYWLAAAARASGDLDRAWAAAAAAWVRAPQAQDRGARLRADLDRLVRQAIIPQRAARLQVRDHGQALAGMLNEWEAFKAQWAR